MEVMEAAARLVGAVQLGFADVVKDTEVQGEKAEPQLVRRWK